MHFKAILRHKDAEIAHLQAKHEVERRRADTEAGRCRTLTSQVSTFSHTEAELRGQLNIYVEKFKQVSTYSIPPLQNFVGYSKLNLQLTMQQVEDTLNNSNELFLTFRKEMEEMSKKTKRLEKENLTLTRKHDQTNRNILEMAEERTRDKEDLERLRKQEQQMRNIIKTMQEQGRGGPLQQDHLDEEGTESEEYEYEDDDEDDEADYEAEEELAAELAKPVFGPVPPPEMVATKANGQKAAATALVNGVKH